MVPKHALGVLQRLVAGVGGDPSGQAGPHVGGRVLLALLADLGDVPDVGEVLVVEPVRLRRGARETRHLPGGELLGERRGQDGTTEDHERFDVLGDRRGVGPRRRRVDGAAGAHVRDQLDRPAVGLHVRLVVVDERLHRLGALGVGVVVADLVVDRAEDDVVLRPLVEDDAHGITGDTDIDRAAVVPVEHGEALRRGDARHQERPGLGVAPIAPLVPVGHSLGGRQPPRHHTFRQVGQGRVTPRPGVDVGVSSATGLAGVDGLTLPLRVARLRSSGPPVRRRGRRGVVGGLVVVTAADHEHHADDGDDRQDRGQRSVPTHHRPSVGSTTGFLGLSHADPPGDVWRRR